MKIKELVRIDYDNLENHKTIHETSIGLFHETDVLTPHGVASSWIPQHLKNVKMYLGWDGQIYPQFKLLEKDVLNES